MELRSCRTLVVAAVIVPIALVAAGAQVASAAQLDPTVAPTTTVSADGRTGTDGTRTLVVSQAADLEPAGARVSVSGSGYVVDKGIYVALCVIPPTNHVPSPCGGGVDTEGTQGAAQWISSNPPSYGVGLAQPYGPGGSFVTSFTVRAEISPGIDCRQVRCAIVSRNDHTRSSDRSQDIVIPVVFRAAPAVTTPPSTAAPVVPPPGGQAPLATTPPSTAPAITVPPLANPTTTLPAPVATVADDGRSATDGVRTLTVSATADLDPEAVAVVVTGEAFDDGRGIYVGLCAVAADGQAPGPCRSGSPTASRWVSSNPPDYGVGVAVPFGAGGTFEVDLDLAAVIDETTDCRQVACAIVARADDTSPDDRTLDLAVPVEFAAASIEPATPDDEPTDEEAAAVTVVDSAAPSSGAPVAVIGGVVVLLAAVGAGVALARRRRAPMAEAAS